MQDGSNAETCLTRGILFCAIWEPPRRSAKWSSAVFASCVCTGLDGGGMSVDSGEERHSVGDILKLRV